MSDTPSSYHVSPNRGNTIQPALVYGGLLIFFAVVSFIVPDRLSGNDSYYHIKYAWLLWKEGRIWDFPWLQGTTFGTAWIDHSLLYHMLLIPFTWLGDLFTAAKAAAAFWAATALFAAYLLIRSFGGKDDPWRRFAWIWAIIVAAVSSGMIYRLSNTRVPSVSLLFIIIAVVLLERERHGWLLPLGFLYAWLYNGAIILIPVTALYALSRWIMDRRFVWSPCLAAAGGLLAGFIVNPYFPGSALFLWKHLQEYALTATPVPVSVEWLETSSWTLFNTSRGAWILLTAGILALCFQGRVLSRRSLFFFLLNLLFLMMNLRARRFVEYWPLFAVLFGASALEESRLPLSAFIKASLPPVFLKDWKITRMAFLSGLVVALCAAAVVSARGAIDSIKQNAPVSRFVAATNWLKANTPKNAIVFNPQWDIFPDLFFHNHHNLWTAGLNEAFVYHREPRLWFLYRGISNGAVPDTARYLKQEFQADYVLTLKRFAGITGAAQAPDNGLETAWQDDQTIIYRIRPSDSILQIEGEYLPRESASKDRDVVCNRAESSECQNYGSPSAGAFLICRSPHQEISLVQRIGIPKTGLWKVEGRFAKGVDMGLVMIQIQGKPVGKPLPLESAATGIGPFELLGEVALNAGDREVQILFKASDSKKLASAGLDALRMTLVSTPTAARP